MTNQLMLEIETEQDRARLSRKLIVAQMWIEIARKKLEACNHGN